MSPFTKQSSLNLINSKRLSFFFFHEFFDGSRNYKAIHCKKINIHGVQLTKFLFIFISVQFNKRRKY